jgi:hypothetical protein
MKIFIHVDTVARHRESIHRADMDCRDEGVLTWHMVDIRERRSRMLRTM